MDHSGMESESNYIVVYTKLWQDIKKRDPKEITAVRSIFYNSDTRQLIVMFFNEEYIVDWDTEKIFRKTDGCFPNVMATIIMLNYLASAKPLQKSAPHWVSVKEIPGGMIFYSTFHRRAISVLTETFGHQVHKLLKSAQSLGGQTAQFGDTSVVFKAFPEVPLCVIVWEGDEEIRANATVLYDSSVRSLLPSGIIIDLGIYIADELKRLA